MYTSKEQIADWWSEEVWVWSERCRITARDVGLERGVWVYSERCEVKLGGVGLE